MTPTMRGLVIAAAVGSGLVGGVFFAFSTFVLPALRRLPAADGVRAMQEINKTAVRPPLMIALFGTAVIGLVLVVAAVRSFGDRPSPWLLAAGVTYLVTAVVVTAAANVPQNDRLAKVDTARPGVAAAWDSFTGTWAPWNHVRTVGCLVACVLFVVALVKDA